VDGVAFLAIRCRADRTTSESPTANRITPTFQADGKSKPAALVSRIDVALMRITRAGWDFFFEVV
jgi:hypothetical protein